MNENNIGFAYFCNGCSIFWMGNAKDNVCSKCGGIITDALNFDEYDKYLDSVISTINDLKIDRVV
mgnify:FL=1